MPIIQGSERHVIKRTDISTTVPTAPVNEDFTDNNFLSTDILKGEFYANIEDERLWLRMNSNIVEIPTTSSLSGVMPFIFDGTNIVTNYVLGSPVIYPKILPQDTEVIDLGSSSYRFKDIYLGNDSVINAKNDLTITVDNLLSTANMEITFNKYIGDTILINCDNNSNLYSSALFGYDQFQSYCADIITGEYGQYTYGTYAISNRINDGGNLDSSFRMDKNKNQLTLENLSSTQFSRISQGMDSSGATTDPQIIGLNSLNSSSGEYARIFLNSDGTNITTSPNIEISNFRTSVGSPAVDITNKLNLGNQIYISSNNSLNYYSNINIDPGQVSISADDSVYTSTCIFTPTGISMECNYTSATIYLDAYNSRIIMNSNVKLIATGHIIQKVNNSAVSSGSLGSNECSFYLDETNDKLMVKVKYADGTTVKTGEIILT